MALPQEKRYTLNDILSGDEQERVELIEGQIYMMAPPSRAHQEVVAALVAQLHNFLEGKKCRVYPAPFAVRLFEKENDRPDDVDTMVEPDISVVCDPEKLDEIGCKGAPTVVMEVLSPSTQRHDRLVKLNLYQRAGVPEYWIINPQDETVQVLILDGGRYVTSEVYGAEDVAKVNALQGCYIELSKVFVD